jgi:hypothetical protein
VTFSVAECVTTDKQAHETGGTTRREGRQMSSRGLVFHLGEEVTSLRQDLEHTDCA